MNPVDRSLSFNDFLLDNNNLKFTGTQLHDINLRWTRINKRCFISLGNKMLKLPWNIMIAINIMFVN